MQWVTRRLEFRLGIPTWVRQDRTSKKMTWRNGRRLNGVGISNTKAKPEESSRRPRAPSCHSRCSHVFERSTWPSGSWQMSASVSFLLQAAGIPYDGPYGSRENTVPEAGNDMPNRRVPLELGVPWFAPRRPSQCTPACPHGPCGHAMSIPALGRFLFSSTRVRSTVRMLGQKPVRSYGLMQDACWRARRGNRGGAEEKSRIRALHSRC